MREGSGGGFALLRTGGASFKKSRMADGESVGDSLLPRSTSLEAARAQRTRPQASVGDWAVRGSG